MRWLISLLPLLLLLAGGYFLIRLRCFFLRHPLRSMKAMCSSLSGHGETSFRILTLALAGTLGVGNIAGVALGLMVGGAGSVLWLIVSAFVSAVLKYAEAALAADGGTAMPGLLRRSFRGRVGRWLGGGYALGALLLALLMGGLLQLRAVTDTAAFFWHLPSLPVVIVYLAAAGFVIFLGGRHVERCTAIIIPICSIMYIILCLFTIFSNISRLPSVCLDILRGAFSPGGAVGGGLSFLCSSALKEGFARGMLSNEAGAGTAAFSHAKNHQVPPMAEGLLGVVEVYVDTLLLCPMTALALLLALPSVPSGQSPMGYVSAALATAWGPLAAPLLFFCVSMFALSTTVCWFSYGAAALGTRSFRARFYPPLFFIALLWGAPALPEGLYLLTDGCLFFLTLLSLGGLIKNADRVMALSAEGLRATVGPAKGSTRTDKGED